MSISRKTPAEASTDRLVRTALVFYGLIFAAALLWRTAFFGEPLLYADPAAAARGALPVRDAGIGLGVGLAIVALSWVVTRTSRWGERLARALAALLGRPRPGQILALAALSGIAEEAFFRGALQPRVGLVAASLLFGAAHFVPRREFLPWTGFSIAAGFVLGGLFAWTGNLIAPIVAHAVVNGVNLTLLVRDYAPDSDGGDGVDLDPGAEG